MSAAGGSGRAGIIDRVMGPTHRALGAVFGVGYGVSMGLPVAGVVGCGVVGTLTAAGVASPDVDQRWGWHDDGFAHVVPTGEWVDLAWELPDPGYYPEIGLAITDATPRRILVADITIER